MGHDEASDTYILTATPVAKSDGSVRWPFKVYQIVGDSPYQLGQVLFEFSGTADTPVTTLVDLVTQGGLPSSGHYFSPTEGIGAHS